jgi:hypothetical protein
MKLHDLVTRADELIVQAQAVLDTTSLSQHGEEWVEEGAFRGLRTATLSFLMKTFGRDHPYYEEVDKRAKVAYPSNVESVAGILKAARNELAGGWLQTTKSLISAEIFTDFLEMAEYLLSEGYKDPSAVMIGSVLEEHLRQLCFANGINVESVVKNKVIPKKADVLNADLAKANIYSKLDQKNITAWLDLRNKAVHGKYAEYTAEQVKFMFQAVAEFIARVQS